MVSSEDCPDTNFDSFLSRLSPTYLTYSVLIALMYPVLLLSIVAASFSDSSDDDFDWSLAHFTLLSCWFWPLSFLYLRIYYLSVLDRGGVFAGCPNNEFGHFLVLFPSRVSRFSVLLVMALIYCAVLDCCLSPYPFVCSVFYSIFLYSIMVASFADCSDNGFDHFHVSFIPRVSHFTYSGWSCCFDCCLFLSPFACSAVSSNFLFLCSDNDVDSFLASFFPSFISPYSVLLVTISVYGAVCFVYLTPLTWRHPQWPQWLLVLDLSSSVQPWPHGSLLSILFHVSCSQGTDKNRDRTCTPRPGLNRKKNSGLRGDRAGVVGYIFKFSFKFMLATVSCGHSLV